nr:uncharacterized protein LOC110567884 [Aotus nancymaae]
MCLPLESRGARRLARCLQTQEHSVHKCREGVRAARGLRPPVSLLREAGISWSELRSLDLEAEGGAPGLSSQKEIAPLFNLGDKRLLLFLTLGVCLLNSVRPTELCQSLGTVGRGRERRVDPPHRSSEGIEWWQQLGVDQPARLGIEGEIFRASEARRFPTTASGSCSSRVWDRAEVVGSEG